MSCFKAVRDRRTDSPHAKFHIIIDSRLLSKLLAQWNQPYAVPDEDEEHTEYSGSPTESGDEPEEEYVGDETEEEHGSDVESVSGSLAQEGGLEDVELDVDQEGVDGEIGVAGEDLSQEPEDEHDPNMDGQQDHDEVLAQQQADPGEHLGVQAQQSPQLHQQMMTIQQQMEGYYQGIVGGAFAGDGGAQQAEEDGEQQAEEGDVEQQAEEDDGEQQAEGEDNGPHLYN